MRQVHTQVQPTAAVIACVRSATFDADTVRQRLRELAFLNSGATIHFHVLPMGGAAGPPPGAPTNGALPAASANGASARGRAEPEQAAEPGLAPEGSGWEVLACPGGLRDYVAYLNKDRQPMHAPIFLSKEVRRPLDRTSVHARTQRMHSRSAVKQPFLLRYACTHL